MHRLCKGVKIGNAPFQLVEAHIWVLNEKWNVVWVEEESCMPPDSDIVLSGSLPHGFQKVLVKDTSDAYLNLWLDRYGRDFYPFSAEVRHQGYVCWANSRRFAICGRSPQQCALLAELMHAYNALANRIEIYASCDGLIALSETNRIGTAIHEDDRSGFEFRDSQACRDAVEGKFSVADTKSSRIFLLHGTVVTMQQRHNDLIHEANLATYRVQQSWHFFPRSLADHAQRLSP